MSLERRRGVLPGDAALDEPARRFTLGLTVDDELLRDSTGRVESVSLVSESAGIDAVLQSYTHANKRNVSMSIVDETQTETKISLRERALCRVYRMCSSTTMIIINNRDERDTKVLVDLLSKQRTSMKFSLNHSKWSVSRCCVVWCCSPLNSALNTT